MLVGHQWLARGVCCRAGVCPSSAGEFRRRFWHKDGLRLALFCLRLCRTAATRSRIR